MIDKVVRCEICAHRCRLETGNIGACRTHSFDGKKIVLLTYGRVLSQSLEPIEKKPLRHFHPGSQVYTAALPGCTLDCSFCTNWELSQQVDDLDLESIPLISPEKIIRDAGGFSADGIAFSFTEPAAGLEYALDVMNLAKENDLFTVWHTNAYLTKHSTDLLKDRLDAACVDLKACGDLQHHSLTGAQLSPIISSIHELIKNGTWVEISTPFFPTLNGTIEHVTNFAKLIHKEFGDEVPWHLIRGMPAYRMSKYPAVLSLDWLKTAELAAKAEGLKFIYPYM